MFLISANIVMVKTLHGRLWKGSVTKHICILGASEPKSCVDVPVMLSIRKLIAWSDICFTTSAWWVPHKVNFLPFHVHFWHILVPSISSTTYGVNDGVLLDPWCSKAIYYGMIPLCCFGALHKLSLFPPFMSRLVGASQWCQTCLRTAARVAPLNI